MYDILVIVFTKTGTSACLCSPTTKSMFYCRLICSKHPQTSIGRLHWTMQKLLLSTLWIATSVDMSHEFSSVLYRQSFRNFRYFAIMPTTRLQPFILFSRYLFTISSHLFSWLQVPHRGAIRHRGCSTQHAHSCCITSIICSTASMQ